MSSALRVRVALAAGLALTLTALAVVLSGAPLTVAGVKPLPSRSVSPITGSSSGCQSAGTVPEGTSAIRLGASSNTGPRVTVRVLEGPRLISEGVQDAGWGTDETVTVPVSRVARAIPGARICTAFGRTLEPVQFSGSLKGQARVEYLRPGPDSWFSLASSVARRMGLGHAAGGTWIVCILAALMIAIAALASRLIVRELR
jgi:hypothetical protein